MFLFHRPMRFVPLFEIVRLTVHRVVIMHHTGTQKAVITLKANRRLRDVLLLLIVLVSLPDSQALEFTPQVQRYIFRAAPWESSISLHTSRFRHREVFGLSLEDHRNLIIPPVCLTLSRARARSICLAATPRRTWK